jgi:dTDP-alpha-D-glucuronic acid decarboxylase
MARERVVVTGGTGFVGSHLTDRLLERGQQVVAFALEPARHHGAVARHPGYRFLQGDVRDASALARLLTPDVACVYHLAATVGVSRYCADPMAVIDVNVLGTRNVLSLAAEHGIRVLFASSSEVLGKNPKVPWEEGDDRVLGSTATERWSYGTTKALGEHMVFALQRSAGLDATIVRFFNVYGPRQVPDFVVSRTIHSVLRGERPKLYDGGGQTRCFTYVDDAVEAAIRAAEMPEARGGVFHVGNAHESRVREVVDIVLRLTGSPLEPEAVDTGTYYGGRYEDIPRRVPRVDRARAVLAWQATTELEDGIARTIEWARQNPWWLE